MMNTKPEGSISNLICFVYTPFGALNAMDYFNNNESKFNGVHFYIISTNRKNHLQIINLIKQQETHNIEIKISVLYSYKNTIFKILNYINLIRCRIKLWAICCRVTADDTIILSHLNNYYSRTIYNLLRDFENFIIVDEGTATFSDFVTIENKGNIPAENIRSYPKSFTESLVEIIYSRKSIEAHNLSFYSFFPLKEFSTHNRLKIIERKPNFTNFEAKVKVGGKEAYFIGQPFVKTGLISKENYQLILKKIVEYYNAQGVQVVYIPHRNEDIRSYDSSIKIKQLSVPFELYVTQMETLPFYVSGFFSTCLLTTAYMLRDSANIELFWGFKELMPSTWDRGKGVLQLFKYEEKNNANFKINLKLHLTS